jgi:hypothetical protein
MPVSRMIRTRRDGRRLALQVCLVALVLAGAFLFLHTGVRADGLCEPQRFVPADGVSLWPPGTRCTYGEPPRTDVLFHPWLALLLLAAIAGGAVALGHRSTRASR